MYIYFKLNFLLFSSQHSIFDFERDCILVLFGKNNILSLQKKKNNKTKSGNKCFVFQMKINFFAKFVMNRERHAKLDCGEIFRMTINCCVTWCCFLLIFFLVLFDSDFSIFYFFFSSFFIYVNRNFSSSSNKEEQEEESLNRMMNFRQSRYVKFSLYLFYMRFIIHLTYWYLLLFTCN